MPQSRLETLGAGLGAFDKEAVSLPELSFISLKGQVPKSFSQFHLWLHKHTMPFSVFNSKIQIRAMKGWLYSLDIFLFSSLRIYGSVCMFLCISFRFLIFLSMNSFLFPLFLYISFDFLLQQLHMPPPPHTLPSLL